MTTETRKRIRAYKKALPELRERVVAVALLLAMSVSMMASASFAWLTISRNPEVSGASTTIAANGNLEIALATSDTAPGKSKVGDSSAAEGQTVTGANITWGNLVNLSDPSYGLEHLTLRPAQLNRSSLLVSPLFGAVYEGDGRVSKLNSSFAYATWDASNEMFMVSDDLGVRAISSTTLEAVGFAQQVYEKRGDAETASLNAGSSYLAITNNKAYMDSLAVIMGTYMTAKMNAGQGDASLTNPSMDQKDIQNLTHVFETFIGVYDQQFDAMAKLINYQLFLLNNSETGSTPYTEVTAAQMKTMTLDALKKENSKLQITGLQEAQNDYAKLCDGLSKLQPLCEQGSVKWEDSKLNDIVNNLMNIGACTLDGTPINNIGVSNATGYLDGKPHNAVLTNGVLYNFEKINGTYCEVKGLSVSAKVKRMGMTIPATISANITTNAPVPSLFSKDMDYADSLNQGAQGVEVAEDTYGLAVDLWVRTNAANSFLILEGNVLTRTDTIRATGTDVNGNTVELWSIDRTIESEDGSSSETITIDLYQLETTTKDETTGEETKTTTWHNATGHSVVTLEENETPREKYKDVVTVIGFEGENRIWEDAKPWEDTSQLSLDSTTQGSGSSYVYYADSPEDQARSLELLGAMNVAFVDDKGALLATAFMDTERFYAENGRVTVPLVLRSDSLEAGTNTAGETIYAISPLEQNVPKRITAIIYLDGTKLTNEDVLAASDIQGKLNIQFGSSVALSHAEDEALLAATRSVSASVDKGNFKYDESLASGTPMTAKVTVNVDGDVPNTVTAFFIRAISATQGSREKAMTFTKQADGTWMAEHTFTAPGEYVLRSVELDGQTYDLAITPKVLVEGFTVESLHCVQADGNRHVSIMTAAASSSVDLELRFATADQAAMPKTVQGRFLREDGTAVNINFTYDATKSIWAGKANFISSGDYTLQYLVLDGEYTELDANLWQTATVYLGMKAAVYTDSPTNFLFLGSEMPDNQQNLYMKVKIMDNTGEEMQGLQDVHLYYAMKGSSLAERGYDAVLTWNGASNYYECTFKSKVGEYSFSQVQVGSNSITYATTSPTFRILSPVPPTFNSGKTVAQQYVAPYATSKGQLKVKLNDCEVGTVYADVTRVKGTATTTYALEGEYVEGEWVFHIPQDTGDGASDGIWTINQLRLWEVYDEKGNEYTEEAPLVIDLTGEEKVSTKVISTVNVSFAPNQSKDFSGNDFMQPYTIKDLNVDFTDYEGKQLTDNNGNPLIKKVQLTFTYSGNSSTYGGYSSNDLTSAAKGAIVTVNLADDGTGTHFVQTADAQLLYAGTYETTFSYEVGTAGTTTVTSAAEKKPANMPVFTVSTNRPTVTISSVDPYQETKRYYLSATPSSLDQVIQGDFNWISDDKLSAAVYVYFNLDNSGRDGEILVPRAPSVTLALSGVPSSVTSGIMKFQSIEAQFSGLTGKVTVGGGTAGEYGGIGLGTIIDSYPTINAVGKQTSKQISIVCGGVTYAVTLSDTVTINQPAYPPYVDFVINDQTYYDEGGTTPVRVYSMDGETISLTLPEPDSWVYQDAKAGKTITDSDYVKTGVVTSDNVYTQTGSGLSTKWYGYTRTFTQERAVSEGQKWTVTKTIIKWSINGEEYTAGQYAQNIPITGAQTAVAIINSQNTNYTDVVTTYTRDHVTFAGGDRIYSTRNREKVSSTSAYYTTPVVETSE